MLEQASCTRGHRHRRGERGVQGGGALRRVNLADPRLVPLPPEARAEAARLLAALMRDATLGSCPGHTPGKNERRSAADLPLAPSPDGKRGTDKDAGEAA